MATKKKEAKTINTSEDREKALSEALAQIQKQFGKGAVMKLGDDNPMMNIEADVDRIYESGSCNRDRRCSQRSYHRGVRTGIFW